MGKEIWVSQHTLVECEVVRRNEWAELMKWAESPLFRATGDAGGTSVMKNHEDALLLLPLPLPPPLLLAAAASAAAEPHDDGKQARLGSGADWGRMKRMGPLLRSWLRQSISRGPTHSAVLVPLHLRSDMDPWIHEHNYGGRHG